MKIRPFLVVPSVALAVALVVLAVATRSPRAGHVGAAPMVWKPGVAYTYALRWRTSQESRLPIQGSSGTVPPATGSLDVDARLIVRAHERKGGVQRLELSLADLHAATVTVLGNERTLPAGVDVVAELAADGRVRAVLAAPGADDTWKLVARQLAGLVLELPIEPGTTTWTAEAPAPFGRASARYRADGAIVTRSRLAYTRLDGALAAGAAAVGQGEGRIELTAGGELRALHDVDDVTASAAASGAASATASGTASGTACGAAAGTASATASGTASGAASGPGAELTFHGASELTLALVSASGDAAPATSFAGYENVDEVMARAIAESRHAALEARIAGMTGERMVADLSAFPDGDLPDRARWFWQVTGMLQAHPELCAKLALPFTSGTLTTTGKALVLDVLAQADSAGAQAVMRTILRSPAAHAGDLYPLLLQRLTLVDAPDAESLAFLRSERDRARAVGEIDTVRAGAYALGGLAETLAREGRSDEARAIAGELAGELIAATTDEDRAHLIVALGATAAADQLPRILAGAGAASGDVRAAAAQALGHITTAEARAAELRLAADTDAGVQATAFAALDAQQLDADALGRIDAIVRRGLDVRCDPIVFRLLATRIHDGRLAVDQVASTLDALHSRAGENPALRQAIEMLLHRG